MPRPSHKPDPELRRQVEALAGFGIPEADMAGLIGIDPKTLRKHYRQELDRGHTKANARVAENLFRKASGDGRVSVTAAIFWLKARARWKETTLNEHTGLDGKPIAQVTEVRRIIVSAPERIAGSPGSPALPAPDTVNGSVIWEAPSR